MECTKAFILKWNTHTHVHTPLQRVNSELQGTKYILGLQENICPKPWLTSQTDHFYKLQGLVKCFWFFFQMMPRIIRQAVPHLWQQAEKILGKEKKTICVLVHFTYFLIVILGKCRNTLMFKWIGWFHYIVYTLKLYLS